MLICKFTKLKERIYSAHQSSESFCGSIGYWQLGIDLLIEPIALAMFPTKGLFRNVFFQPYNDQGSARIQSSAKDSKHLVQRLCLEKILENHKGFVNSVHWNDTGSLLLTAGDYNRIVITNPYSYKVTVDYETKPKNKIFCAKFLPTTDNRIISCADGLILNLDLNKLKETEKNFVACHLSTSFLETIPGDPNTFINCSNGHTIFQFDLRIPNHCFKKYSKKHVLIDCDEKVSAIVINPMRPHQLAIATNDGIVRIVDRRKIIAQNPANKIVPECIFTAPPVHLGHYSHTILSLSYSPDGKEMLVSCIDQKLYLFSVDNAVANDFLDNTPKPPPYKQIRLRDPETRARMKQYKAMSQMSDTFVEINDVPNNVDIIEHDNDVNIIDESLTSNDIDQSTSDGNNQRVKLKTINRSSMFDDIVPFQPIKAQYEGHRQVQNRNEIATFWGNNFIMSGSNCGHVFIWDRYTCEVVMLLKENNGVDWNCILPHPSRPILATSSYGPCVKLWSPTDEDSKFSQSFANKLVERNVKLHQKWMSKSPKFRYIV